MGKSAKKVKAERINAIRKQYDAFLEEDRKRKERNHYILERLDKIRSCSEVLPIRNVPKVVYSLTNFRPVVNEQKRDMETNPLSKNSESLFREVNTQNMLTALKEIALLKEIRKDYILIPRHTHALECENKSSIKSNNKDNSNWKSKYSILEELMGNKKEEQKKCFVSNDKQISYYYHNEELDDHKIEQTNDNAQSNNSAFSSLQLSKERDEKITDNSKILSDFDESTKIEKQVDEICYDSNEISILSDMQLKNNIDTLPRIMDTAKKLTSNINSSSDISPLKEQVKLSIDHKYNNVQIKDNINKTTDKERIQDEYKIKFRPQDIDPLIEGCVEYSHVGNENKMESSTECKQTNETQNQQCSKSHATDYEMLYSKKQQLDDNIKAIENTDISFLNTSDQRIEEKDRSQIISDKHKQVHDSNQDIDKDYKPQDLPKIDTNPIDPAQINDKIKSEDENINIGIENQIEQFEAEQNNMFYSEEPNVNYAYNEMGVNDTVQADYTNKTAYIQDENYVYYEEAPEEHAYIDINEHEESNEQYDPHYEEQYGNIEQAIQESTNIEQLETEENASFYQSNDQLQPENLEYNSIQEVEQQLDTEQGYKEPVKITEENINNEQQISERLITEEEAIIT